MKKGFTLIELLVVTLVIAILASIVFRLTGSVGSVGARQDTIMRMQKLENCLSGYYAAFGSYPPVVYRGSRDPFCKVDEFGIQITDEPPSTELTKEQIDAACKAQPVRATFPFNTMGQQETVKGISDMIQKLMREDSEYAEAFKEVPAAKYGFDGLSNPSQLSANQNATEWGDICLFQFGLMSFLLPRYLLMMGNEDNSIYDGYAQWFGNNSRPHKFETGVQYGSWAEMNPQVKPSALDRWKVEMMPSQSLTRRWLPNLERLCAGSGINSDFEFYGISIIDSEKSIPPSPMHPDAIQVYPTGGGGKSEHGGASQLYMLNYVTLADGWGNDFYYYSPPPYQGYRLWSAGENGTTFPPWYPPEQLSGLKDRAIQGAGMTVGQAIDDDIVQLSAMR